MYNVSPVYLSCSKLEQTKDDCILSVNGFIFYECISFFIILCVCVLFSWQDHEYIFNQFMHCFVFQNCYIYQGCTNIFRPKGQISNFIVRGGPQVLLHMDGSVEEKQHKQWNKVLRGLHGAVSGRMRPTGSSLCTPDYEF